MTRVIRVCHVYTLDGFLDAYSGPKIELFSGLELFFTKFGGLKRGKRTRVARGCPPAAAGSLESPLREQVSQNVRDRAGSGDFAKNARSGSETKVFRKT